jgi:amidase
VGTTWVGASALQLARAVQRGDTSATTTVADHLEHAHVADRILTVGRVLREGAAMAEAEQVDDLPDLGNLPLAGVPVLVSDNTPVAGLPTWNGSAAAQGPVAERDHEVVRRLRGAGSVVIGVARTSEFGLWPTTDDATGVTRNPWRTDRTAGGSAGGAAAAVAAGLVPLAFATDGFGSLRIPAACCGVVGFKPGRGILPYGSGTSDWFGLAEHGILATTVADAAAAFAVLSGHQPALDEPAPDQGRLRIAISMRNLSPGHPPDSDTRDSVLQATRLLVAGGYDAIRAEVPHPARLTVITTATWSAVAHREAAVAYRDAADEAAAADREAVDETDDAATDDLQPRTRRHAAWGARALRRGLVREGERADWRERCAAWFADGGFDLLLTPALPGPPPPADVWSGRSWRANVALAMRFAPYTAMWNVAGFPAIVIPMGERRDGLPASVQLVGTPGAEERLLAVAARIEQAAPWRPHAPTWPRIPASTWPRTPAPTVDRRRALADRI